jgi:tRNA A-37 threonylcarbamoyl transferase component Bud32
VTEVWALPGYDVQALIGYGAAGEVWRARELESGDLVALKRLRADTDPTALAALRRDAAMLRALDTPYVVRLRALLGEGADAVLVLDLATGGSLTALLARRGSLDPAEVVTVAAPLAQALAAAHGCGLVHGNVTPSNVLFTAEGMPLLADLGVPRDASTDAAADVRALAAICHQLLSGTAPSEGETRAPLGLLAPSAPLPLVAAIEHALSDEPSARPDAAAFAAALRRSHAAAPVRFAEPGPSSPSPSPAPWPSPSPSPSPSPDVRPVPAPPADPATPAGRSRRPVLVAALAAVLVLAAGVGWASGRAAPMQPAAAAAPAVPDWTAVLDALDAARSRAFESGDATALSEVYAPGSAQLAADRAALLELVDSGRRARGVRHAFRRVEATSYDERTATLRVLDVLSAYDVVDGAGRVVQRPPGRSAAAFVVTLLHTADGWRLQQVQPA